MSFDEKVREIYLGEIYKIEDRLKFLIFSFPAEHRKLLGLRATFIKWEMIYAEKIERATHQDITCGVCVTRENHIGEFNCKSCPLKYACQYRQKRTTKTNMMKAYESYMREHERFGEKG